MRLQSDLQRVQELNSVMKDQVDILQSQLLAPSEHQILIAQLFTQSKLIFFLLIREHIDLFEAKTRPQNNETFHIVLKTCCLF